MSTELLKAAKDGRADRIKEMLDRGASMSTRNNFGVSPLIFAANNGHLETVEVRS
jgi:ankyrin repeat protein